MINYDYKNIESLSPNPIKIKFTTCYAAIFLSATGRHQFFERAYENGTLLQTLKNDNMRRERNKINPLQWVSWSNTPYQFQILKAPQTIFVLTADKEFDIYLVQNDS